MDRMSVSLRVVSSNPGVSIRVTRRPLTTNGREVRTSLVQLSRPRPTGRFDLLALLINYALWDVHHPWAGIPYFLTICRWPLCVPYTFLHFQSFWNMSQYHALFWSIRDHSLDFRICLKNHLNIAAKQNKYFKYNVLNSSIWSHYGYTGSRSYPDLAFSDPDLSVIYLGTYNVYWDNKIPSPQDRELLVCCGTRAWWCIVLRWWHQD